MSTEIETDAEPGRSTPERATLFRDQLVALDLSQSPDHAEAS